MLLNFLSNALKFSNEMQTVDIILNVKKIFEAKSQIEDIQEEIWDDFE